VTFDGATLRMFVNSHLETTNDGKRPLADFDGELDIGAFSNGSNPFSGLIDEVAIYDKALPLSRIQQHFAKGVGGQ
jgi:hypothetical protein